MKKTESIQISENTSKRLFLSNLRPNDSNDDNIKDLILSLNKAIKNKSNKIDCLDSLEYKLRHIRYRNIIGKIEEEREIKNKSDKKIET